MIVKLLTEHHLEFLSLKGDCRGSSESILVKMSNLLFHATAHFANNKSCLAMLEVWWNVVRGGEC